MPDLPNGNVIITWPSVADGLIPGWGVTVTDAATGRPITTVMAVTVNVDPRRVITADLVMICDEEGQPILDGSINAAVKKDGSIRSDTFRWMVTEMRVTE